MDERELTLKVRVPENVKDGAYPVKIGLRPYGEDIRNYDTIYKEFTVTIDRNAMSNMEIYSDTENRKISLLFSFLKDIFDKRNLYIFFQRTFKFRS